MSYKLYNGDCLEIMDKLIAAGVKVDAIITDPPYGTTSCKWDSIIPLDEMWCSLNKLIKPNGGIILFGSQPFTTSLIYSNIKHFKHQWIWNKSSAGNILVAKYQPLKVEEEILVFTGNGERVNYYPILTVDNKRDLTKEKPTIKQTDLFSGIKSEEFYKTEKNKKGTERYPKNIINISTQATECANSKRVHPTQKPVALLEYLIKTYTREGELVLDFTMGSGSTGVACLNINRDFIGIEKDEKYFNIASNRIGNNKLNDVDDKVIVENNTSKKQKKLF
nr:MAG TPA: adenine-specific methyltransferase [Caudoviricetes sp.]